MEAYHPGRETHRQGTEAVPWAKSAAFIVSGPHTPKSAGPRPKRRRGSAGRCLMRSSSTRHIGRRFAKRCSRSTMDDAPLAVPADASRSTTGHTLTVETNCDTWTIWPYSVLPVTGPRMASAHEQEKAHMGHTASDLVGRCALAVSKARRTLHPLAQEQPNGTLLPITGAHRHNDRSKRPHGQKSACGAEGGWGA